MPPEDDLFASNAAEGSSASATRGNGSDPGAEGSAAKGPLSKEDVLGIVKEFVEPNTEMMGRLTRNQQELANTIGEVRGVLERLGVAAPKDDEGGEGLDIAQLLADPEALGKLIQKSTEKTTAEFFKREIAPVLSLNIESTHQQTVSNLKRDIDDKYGEGTWAREFAPELDPLFERTRREAPSRLGDAEAIRKAVEVIKGEKFDTLAAAKVKADEARKEAREQQMNETREFVTSTLSGGIGVKRETSSLSDEGKEFLSRIFQATGDKVDEKEFLASLNSGSTYDEWLESRKKHGLT